MFIGGPLHRQVRTCRLSDDLIPCGDGEYSSAEFGFPGQEIERVFVWSGMHMNEALSEVMNVLAGNVAPTSLTVSILQNPCRLLINSFICSVEIPLPKSSIDTMIDALTTAYNAADD
jgi:uncharacterized protein YejL (UPF0352 family)